MSQPLSNASTVLWHRLVESRGTFSRALGEFLAEGVDRVAVLRGRERATALYVAPYLKIPERLRLFPEWVFLASFAHGSIHVPRAMILSLPREWVLAHIEQEAEPFLQDGTYDEYRRFLELYEQLNRDLTLKLARRAAEHSDPDIREAGEDFLQELMEPGRSADQP
jgi:hypothetical protein